MALFAPADTFAYVNLSNAIVRIDGTDVVDRSTWNSGTSYAVNDVVEYISAIFVCLATNTNQTPPTTGFRNDYWAVLVKTTGAPPDVTVEEAYNLALAAQVAAGSALTTAWSGTTLAYRALQTAWSGTSGADSALARASTGTLEAEAAIVLANQALQTAWVGTNAAGATALATTALQTAWTGTAGASAAITLANQALTTAFSGTAGVAQVQTTAVAGTNRGASAIDLANQALVTAWAGTSDSGNAATAYTALQTAWSGTAGVAQVQTTAIAGTNRGASAIDLANQALTTAWAGTTGAGSSALAYTALQTAWSGTAGVNQVFPIANAGTDLAILALTWIGTHINNNADVLAREQAYVALQTAWSGTAGVGQLLGIITSGTNSLQSQIDSLSGGVDAYAALQTAWSGTAAAAAGISLANQALVRSWAGTSAIDLANQALVTAWVGTETGGGDGVLAQAAYNLASIGTNVGTNALTVATAGSNLAWAAYVLASSEGGGSSSITGTTAVNLMVSGAKLPATASARIDGGEQEWRLMMAKGESALWQLLVPPDYGSNLTAKMAFGPAYSQAGTNNSTVFGVGVAAVTPSDSVQYASKAFAVMNYGTFALQGTLPGGSPCGGEVAISNNDSLAPGDTLLVKLERPNFTADNMGGDMAVYALTLEYRTSPTQVSVSATTYGTVPYSTASSGTIYYDFAGSTYQETTVEGNLWVSAVNMSAGRELGIILVPGATTRTIGYSNFKWFGTTPPPEISNKEIMIALVAKDTTIAATRGAWSSQI